MGKPLNKPTSPPTAPWVPPATPASPAEPPGASSEASPKAPPRMVALLVETSNEYARGLLRGVVAYMREHQHWTTYLAEHGRGDEPPDWLGQWRGDGILARIENPRIADAVVAAG